MTVTELMTGITPNPAATGDAVADEFAFALNIASTPSDDPNDWLVAENGITEVSGAMSATTVSSNYLRQGVQDTKTSNSKVFTLTGDKKRGDPFQEALFSHALKWGIGETVVKDYVYFDMVTGKGEKGKVMCNVEGDLSGAAGANAGISATFSVRGTPAEYTYTAPTP